eukprot:6486916-Amphidinium_carterae.1
MRAAGPRAATNSTFLTFGTGQTTVQLSQHPSDPMSELLAIGADFVDSMDMALSGAGWLRPDPVSTNRIVGSALKMLAEGTAVTEDDQAFRALISSATETKGLAAIKGIDMTTEKGIVMMGLMRMQNKVVDLEEMEAELKACLKRTNALNPDDVLAVRPLLVERYTEYVDLVKTEIPEVEDFLRDNTVASPLLRLTAEATATAATTGAGTAKGKGKSKTSGRMTEEATL